MVSAITCHECNEADKTMGIYVITRYTHIWNRIYYFSVLYTFKIVRNCTYDTIVTYIHAVVLETHLIGMCSHNHYAATTPSQECEVGFLTLLAINFCLRCGVMVSACTYIASFI